MIKINNLLKIFNKNKSNEVRAINDVSVEFPEKGLVAIYGASGSGKTTLMNALGGLDKFDGGEIIMDGNVYKKSVDDKYRIENIGYIFQNYLLDERLDVYQNVAQGLRTVGVKDEETIFDRVMTALDNVGMRDYFKRNITTLSGGQQQRVAIARAMVKGAKIILADEPTGNLDEINTRIVMDLLKAMSGNCLVIVVTHEGDLIDKYADSVIEIKDGKVENLSEGANISQETSDKTRIFLGDKKKSQLKTQGVNIVYYGEAADVNLILVNENGKIYLKTDDSSVKFVDDKSEVKFVDKTEKEFYEEQRVKTYGAIKFLGNVETGKTGAVFSFRKSFAEGLKSVFSKKKRMMLFTVSVFLFMIGVIFLTGVLGANIHRYETFGDEISPNVVTVRIDDAENKKAIDKIIAEKGFDVRYESVLDMFTMLSMNISGFETISSNISKSVGFACMDIAEVYDMKWLYGTEEDLDAYNKVVISKGLADKLLAAWLNSSQINGKGYELLYNSYALFGSQQVKIVGVVRGDDCFLYVNDLLCCSTAFDYIPDTYFNVEAKDNEVLVPTGYKFSDTKTIYGKEFTVKESDKVTDYTINEKELRAIADRFDTNEELHIVTDDVKELSEVLMANGFAGRVYTRYIVYEMELDMIKSNIKVWLIIDAILIGIMLLATFFMFYASMSTKTKEIGLYRAIGVSTGNIVFKFFVESLAMVLLCVISVYVLIGIPIISLSDGTGMYFPLWLYFASMFGIGACMLLISFIPMLRFLRKTPVQILAKYDA